MFQAIRYFQIGFDFVGQAIPEKMLRTQVVVGFGKTPKAACFQADEKVNSICTEYKRGDMLHLIREEIVIVLNSRGEVVALTGYSKTWSSFVAKFLGGELKGVYPTIDKVMPGVCRKAREFHRKEWIRQIKSLLGGVA